MPVDPTPIQLPISDHDLLLTLNANVTSLREDFKNGLSTQATQLSDHETRVRILEADNAQFKGAIRSLTTAMTVVGVIATISIAVASWLALVPHK